MLVNHLQSSAQRGQASLSHTAGSHPKIYQHSSVQHGGEILNYPVSQEKTLHTTNGLTRYSPNSAVPSISTAQMVEIRVPSGSCGSILSMVAEIKVSNAGAALAEFGGYAFNLLDTNRGIEIWSNNGSQLLERFSRDALAQNIRYDSSVENNSFRQALESVPLATGVPPAGSETFYIEIPSVLAKNHIGMNAFRDDLYVRIHFRANADSHTTADFVDLDTVAVVVQNLNWSADIQRSLVARSRSSTLDYRYWHNLYQQENIVLAPSTRYTVRLSGVHGVVDSIDFFLRLNGHVGLDTFDYAVKPESYELLDSGGKSLLGASIVPTKFQGVQQRQLGLLPNRETINKFMDNSILIPLSADTKHNVEKGTSAGFYVFSGNESLAFTTDATLAPGLYQVTVTYKQAHRLRLTRGVASVHSS